MTQPLSEYHYNYEGTKFKSPIELSVDEQGLFARVFIKGRETPMGVVPPEDIIAIRLVLKRLLKATGGVIPR